MQDGKGLSMTIGTCEAANTLGKAGTETPERLAVSVPIAAQMLGISPHTVRFYLRHMKIASVRFGRRVSIPMSEVQRLSREGIPSRLTPIESEVPHEQWQRRST
jgi:hypothetical protein